MSLEHDLQVTVLAWAKMAPGVRLWRNRSNDYSRVKKRNPDKDRKGSPDLEGWVDGWYLGVELKRQGARPREHEARQEIWADRIRSAGGCHIKADDLLDVMEGIEKFRREKNGPAFGS